MSWTAYHRRGDVLRAVVDVVDSRLDGRLPTDVAGVAETFGTGDQGRAALLGALTLRWHTVLAARIERELASQPMDLASGVAAAWVSTALDLPGTRAVMDRLRGEHAVADGTPAAALEAGDPVAFVLAKSAEKEHALMAVMAGRTSIDDPRAPRIGVEIEAHAREVLAAERAVRSGAAAGPVIPQPRSIIDRVRAAFAAA